jgi:hypothetical protein
METRQKARERTLAAKAAGKLTLTVVRANAQPLPGT